MAEKDRLGSYPSRMSVDEIVGRAFPSKVRGISEQDVRNFLRRVGDEVERLTKREDELLGTISNLQEKLKVKPQVTKAELLERLGEQTTQVLSSAEQAADLMLREAREESERILKEAKVRSEELTSTSISLSQEKLEEVQQRIHSLKESSLREADSVIQEAREKGREIFQETVIVREQILKDLLRRRDLLFEQIDELRKGREELLDSYKIVKGSFQKATDALHSVEEKASSELLVDPIDVDEMLKTPVELPRTLEISEPIIHKEQVEIPDDISSIGQEIKDATPEKVNDHKGVVPQDSHEESKKRGFKGYMKDALGVGEPAKQLDETITSQEVPDKVKAIETVVVKTVPKNKKNQQTISQDSIDDEQASTPKKDVGELFKSIKDHKLDDVRDIKESKDKTINISSNDKEQITSDLKSQAKAKSQSKTKKKDKIEDNPIARRDEVVNSITTAILRNAKRQLQDEQNQLLDSLRTLKPKKFISAENLLPAQDTHIKIWSEVIHNELQIVFNGGVSSVTKQTRIYDDDSLLQSVRWVVLPLRESIIRSIDDGDIVDAQTRVGARYREWRNTELKNVLYDALCSAYNQGVLAGVDQDAKLKWNVTKVGQCPDCDDNALEQTTAFEMFPTGQVAPPSHAGCRCVLTIA